MRGTYNPASSNASIRERYEAWIKTARADAEHRVSDIKALYQAKEQAIEDSAANVNKSYESGNQTGKVTLSPVGTHMNVHSYQTSDEPSGSPVPVKAAPAKSLPQAK
jgi:hypothetical protein